jgi:prepilin-type N-terminal cleavage/methylation domain-containing protein/prepilin-type processing-associated H-X9-DG protein
MNRPKDIPRGGFTLVELIVTVAILGVLLALLAPALARAIDMADQTACASNLQQLAVAMNLYLKDNDGWFFPLRTAARGGIAWYYGYEPASSAGAGEGNRVLDRTQSKLYPYLQSTYATVEICPAFRYDGAYKAKYDCRWWTYGINYELSNFGKGRNYGEIRGRDRSRTVVFADAAQINTWQPPASPANPLVEEWFYVQPGQRMVHFRHSGTANVLMADWHVEACDPAKNSFHPLLPSARIGYLDTKQVLFRPLGR